MIQAYFSGIKDRLIGNISSSTNNIVIAMAWFTHRDIFNAILSVLDNGVSVSLILIDDLINCSEYGLDFDTFIKKGGMIRFADTRKYLMHNKFCIFDDKTLVTGSYNWTYSAEKQNAENIIETDDLNVCKDFKNHFNHLWDTLTPITEYTHKNISNIVDKEFIRDYDDFYDECENMASNNVIKRKALNDIQSRKSNILVTKIATVKKASNRAEPKLKCSLGLGVYNRNDIDRKENGDIIDWIIRKGVKLPYTNTINTETIYDNQKSVRCGIYCGEGRYEKDNKLLLEAVLDKLPKLPAGRVKFKTKLNVDTNGYIHLESLCVNTGEAQEVVYICPELIEYN